MTATPQRDQDDSLVCELLALGAYADQTSCCGSQLGVAENARGVAV